MYVLRGVGQWRSTYETLEQRQEIVGGECGGKAAGQGEHSSVPHVPDTVREPRVPGVDGGAAGRVRFAAMSETRAVCANERTYGSVRGAPGNRCPYRDFDSSHYVYENKWT